MTPSSGLSPKAFAGGLVLAVIITVGGCLGGSSFDADPSTVAGRPSGSSSGASGSPGASSGATGGGAASVTIQNAQYAPKALTVAAGTTVTWKNLDGYTHTVTPDDAAAWGSPGSGDNPTEWLKPQGTWAFTFKTPGTYTYHCIPHSYPNGEGKFAGQTGTIVVEAATGAASAPPVASPPSAAPTPAVSAVRSPVAPALLSPGDDGKVHVSLETKEIKATIADGVTYSFWTFDGTVPGPMVRVKEGDTVALTLANDASSALAHSIDLHAVTGPGGGAKVTQTTPGDATSFEFKALNPGVYVYHCATPHVPSHVANGMYGLIVVEPKEGLPPVDREFYVMQGEIYPTGDLGEKGDFGLSMDKLLNEDAEYFLLNGAVGALTGENALTAEVGETVRIWFGVGGFVPSSFHVIGEIFDRVYPEGGFPATTHVQTTLVPAGGATMVEFEVEYPGTYLLVDHWLTHAIDRGAAGHLVVTGDADDAVFRGTETAGSGH